MKIRLRELLIVTTTSEERIVFSADATFLHGPIGTGKSTTVRLIDYCLGGDLERTPAVQKVFVSAALLLDIGDAEARFERSASDKGRVRVSWTRAGQVEAVDAPIDAGPQPIYGDAAYNLSDLVFTLAGSTPIRVRRSKRDPDSPLVRLSIRDLMFYCYLDQDHLDSSFYRLEDRDGFRRLKSMDAMRFVLGLHSERMNELDGQLASAQDEQRAKRVAVEQLRRFLSQFKLASPLEIEQQVASAKAEMAASDTRRKAVETGQAQAKMSSRRSGRHTRTSLYECSSSEPYAQS